MSFFKKEIKIKEIKISPNKIQLIFIYIFNEDMVMYK